MRLGKVSDSVLKRSVLKKIKTHSKFYLVKVELLCSHTLTKQYMI